MKRINSRKTALRLALGALLFVGVQSQASVASGITLLGDLVFSGPTASKGGQDLKFSSKSALGGGVQVDFFIAEQFGLEVGALYLSRKYDRENYVVAGTPVTTTFTNGYFQIPALLRFKPIKILSLGLGGFYSQNVGDYSGSATVNGTKQEIKVSGSDLGLDSGDWGAVAAVGVDVPLTDTLSLLGDIRLTQSLKNSSSQNVDSWKFRDVHVMAGLRFAFGGPN